MSERSFAKAAAVFGLSLGMGVAAGVAAENHTNEVAKGKIVTVEACTRAFPQEITINKQLERCLEAGVPGGQEIGTKVFNEGQPVEFMDAYVNAQRNEARQIELGRLVIWSVVPDAAGIAYGGWLIFF